MSAIKDCIKSNFGYAQRRGCSEHGCRLTLGKELGDHIVLKGEEIQQSDGAKQQVKMCDCMIFVGTVPLLSVLWN
ncbi:hypothetical protein ACFL6S_26925 [Candidatus Poribacteria bacterium]